MNESREPLNTKYEANNNWGAKDNPRFTCDDCGCDRWFVVEFPGFLQPGNIPAPVMMLCCTNCHGSTRFPKNALGRDSM
jgi:hypothetical protein